MTVHQFGMNLTTPEIVLLGGAGCLICSAFALGFDGGYRRGAVVTAVVCVLIGALTPFTAFLAGERPSLFWLIPLIFGSMALATVFLVPILMIAGLCEGSYLWKTKLWHASFVGAAWILGIGMVAYPLLDGFH